MFTNETISAYCSRFLYCISQSNVEVYTLRSSEFPETLNFPSPCMIGMQPLIGLLNIVVSGPHIILLNKFIQDTFLKPTIKKVLQTPFALSKSGLQIEDKRNERSLNKSADPAVDGFNLYVFKAPYLTNLLNELSELATSHKENNRDYYYNLTLEAYHLVEFRASQLSAQICYLNQYFSQGRVFDGFLKN